MFVSRRAVLVSVIAMFEGRGGVLFGCGVTAVVVMMSRCTMMMGGKFVMRRRSVMMLGRMMFDLCHNKVSVV